jgi:hypothetical protein
MKIRLIRSPTEAFLEMLLNNVRPLERKRFEGSHWGAVGLVQAKLIELYWAADVAEKASNVRTALVMGNCPQHIQMLAVVGQQAAVQAALDKIREASRE